MSPPIECIALSKKFGHLTAVRDLNLSLEEGTVLGFVGPNGAGKSTTIRMLLGLARPSAGSVRIFGSEPQRDVKVRGRVGYSPGELRLDDRLSVKTTLASWARLRGTVDAGFRDELIERLDVQPDRQVRGLSTGNRRKVALVGALMSKPDLLILDEPTNGLDPIVQSEFMTILSEAALRGTSILLSSHILSEVERIADLVLVIRAGAIVASGPTKQLRGDLPQIFRANFRTDAPAATQFEQLTGTIKVEKPHSRELLIHWSGPPGPLLSRLADYELDSLTAPEPDLEQAFLSYYRSDQPTDAKRGES